MKYIARMKTAVTYISLILGSIRRTVTWITSAMSILWNTQPCLIYWKTTLSIILLTMSPVLKQDLIPMVVKTEAGILWKI